MRPLYWILALDVWETGVLAMAMSTVSLVGSIAIYVWHRLRARNAPHAEFIATDGSHLKRSVSIQELTELSMSVKEVTDLSMSMKEVTEQVRRIVRQFEVSDPSRPAVTTGDKPLSDDSSVRTQ